VAIVYPRGGWPRGKKRGKRKEERWRCNPRRQAEKLDCKGKEERFWRRWYHGSSARNKGIHNLTQGTTPTKEKWHCLIKKIFKRASREERWMLAARGEKVMRTRQKERGENEQVFRYFTPLHRGRRGKKKKIRRPEEKKMACDLLFLSFEEGKKGGSRSVSTGVLEAERGISWPECCSMRLKWDLSRGKERRTSVGGWGFQCGREGGKDHLVSNSLRREEEKKKRKRRLVRYYGEKDTPAGMKEKKRKGPTACST